MWYLPELDNSNCPSRGRVSFGQTSSFNDLLPTFRQHSHTLLRHHSDSFYDRLDITISFILFKNSRYEVKDLFNLVA